MPKMERNNVIKMYTYQVKNVNEKDKPLINFIRCQVSFDSTINALKFVNSNDYIVYESLLNRQ